jgi:hypothetical protein
MIAPFWLLLKERSLPCSWCHAVARCGQKPRPRSFAGRGRAPLAVRCVVDPLEQFILEAEKIALRRCRPASILVRAAGNFFSTWAPRPRADAGRRGGAAPARDLRMTLGFTTASVDWPTDVPDLRRYRRGPETTPPR